MERGKKKTPVTTEESCFQARSKMVTESILARADRMERVIDSLRGHPGFSDPKEVYPEDNLR